MKTAMQTLLEDIEFLMPETYNSLNKKFELKKYYLEKEKEQIINACNSGLSGIPRSAEKYYNETFK